MKRVSASDESRWIMAASGVWWRYMQVPWLLSKVSHHPHVITRSYRVVNSMNPITPSSGEWLNKFLTCSTTIPTAPSSDNNTASNVHFINTTLKTVNFITFHHLLYLRFVFVVCTFYVIIVHFYIICSTYFTLAHVVFHILYFYHKHFIQ